VSDFFNRLCAELLELNKGIEYTASYEDGRTQTFFLQCRLVQHLLDTKAVEKFFKLQASGSFYGCPCCGLIRGTKKSRIGSTVYYDHRHCLPINHPL
jgi:hypothetical protein